MEISNLLHGKVIDYVAFDDELMYVFLTNGQRARIAWEKDGPKLKGIDVVIKLGEVGFPLPGA